MEISFMRGYEIGVAVGCMPINWLKNVTDEMFLSTIKDYCLKNHITPLSSKEEEELLSYMDYRNRVTA